METLLKHFWSKVDIRGDDECWEWQASRINNYGNFSIGKRYGCSNIASRFIWGALNGPIPEGLKILHTCDNPPCCNPKHLFLGSSKDNSEDMVKKGRSAKGKKNARYGKPGTMLGMRGEFSPAFGRTGENHPMSKLTKTQVIDIKYGTLSPKELRVKYGVSAPRVSEIRSGKSWKHL